MPALAVRTVDSRNRTLKRTTFSFFYLVISTTLLGIGGSSIVTAANDGKTMLKGYKAWDGDQLLALKEENGCQKLLAKEEHVYRLLGEYFHILRCYGLVEVRPSVHSPRLERALYGNVREFIRNNKKTSLSKEDQLNMALGASSGIAYMHSKNIIHCDINCRNLLLFPNWVVKVGNFASARDGNPSENNIVEEIRYKLPLRGREMSFKELGTDDVEKRYAAEEFPDVTCVLAGDIIRDYWDEKFETAEDIEGAIKKL
ncbi:kinase-like domain-containing protein [Rhexocercosporidium sp. MPI-PUGE-AT-0058]|nr:kinase-like domain-containing protein [Rhexocercosporidium sp. MPI-PUGE-AT-0058]